MKKLIVWALLATLMVAGSAFAAPPAKIAPNATFPTGGAATTNNDDSCDIGVAPAATLLLPYFEVDIADPTGENTLFTITNTSSEEAIAHVVLWTNWSYPVVDFNIYLTGYDVQSISLYDVIARGVIAPAAGDKTDVGTGTDISPNARADQDYLDLGPADYSDCVSLPGNVPEFYVTRMQNAFTLGTVAAAQGFGACNFVGTVNENAVGYATIDVAEVCGTGLPTDGVDYFTEEMRFDNILIGDYQQLNDGNNFAQGETMVHIRAVPELDGEPGDFATNFDRTFYSRYQDGGTADRRQPLPATFAARWIDGGPGSWATYFKVWREGVTGEAAETSCSATPGSDTWSGNGSLSVRDWVTFDEDENAEGLGAPGGPIISPPQPGAPGLTTRETQLLNVASASFPQVDANAGWIYLNLDHGSPEDPIGVPAPTAGSLADSIASQNWVIVSMRAEGRFSVDFDAAWLGNGCSPVVGVSEITSPLTGGEIGPADNVTPDYTP
jgi:hypothetical protein